MSKSTKIVFVFYLVVLCYSLFLLFGQMLSRSFKEESYRAFQEFCKKNNKFIFYIKNSYFIFLLIVRLVFYFLIAYNL